MKITGDEVTIFNPDTGNDEYLVDSDNDVHDLRRERNDLDTEESDPSKELEQ